MSDSITSSLAVPLMAVSSSSYSALSESSSLPFSALPSAPFLRASSPDSGVLALCLILNFSVKWASFAFSSYRIYSLFWFSCCLIVSRDFITDESYPSVLVLRLIMNLLWYSLILKTKSASLLLEFTDVFAIFWMVLVTYNRASLNILLDTISMKSSHDIFRFAPCTMLSPISCL